MTALDNQMETKENKAEIEMLNNKLNALIKILVKEGITTKEEVDDMTKDLIEKKDDE